MSVTADTVEQAAIEWFEELGYAYLAGPSIAPGEPGAERDSYCDVVLKTPPTHNLPGVSDPGPRLYRRNGVAVRVGQPASSTLMKWRRS